MVVNLTCTDIVGPSRLPGCAHRARASSVYQRGVHLIAIGTRRGVRDTLNKGQLCRSFSPWAGILVCEAFLARTTDGFRSVISPLQGL